VSRSGFFSVARFVAWRNIKDTMRQPALILPTILLPLLFLISFVGALSSLTEVKGFPDVNYTAFQYVYALLQAVSFAGAVGGTAMIEDFESGFMDRLMLASRRRGAIVAGYVIAMFARGLLAVVVLTAMAYVLGMRIEGSVIDVAGLAGLALGMNLISSLWSTGVAMHVRTVNAAPGAILPIFLLLFLTPVFLPLSLLTGWLHAVANANPFTQPIEAGRSLIAGDPDGVPLAFAVTAALLLGTLLWAIWGVRRAEHSG
jgi:ABC-type multidrug transport system permease subunit